MQLSPERVRFNLTGKISDADLDRIGRNFPLSDRCPTCDGQGRYHLDGETYDCDCSYQKLLQRHYFNANIGREYQNICLKDFIGEDAEKVVPIVNDYIENFKNKYDYGIGLTFSGDLGTGKTFAMTSILKELVKQGESVFFVTFEELINLWGDSWHNAEAKAVIQDRVRTAKLLGIDELRTDGRNASGFLANGFDSIVRFRTSNLMPTLVTTNMTRQDEEKEFSKVYSLLSAKNERVSFVGSDKRRKEIRQRTIERSERGDKMPIC
jgi:DNA replication protein DnaC